MIRDKNDLTSACCYCVTKICILLIIRDTKKKWSRKKIPMNCKKKKWPNLSVEFYVLFADAAAARIVTIDWGGWDIPDTVLHQVKV